MDAWHGGLAGGGREAAWIGGGLQPMPWQMKPGTQHPPPRSDAQAVLPSVQFWTPPEQVAPAGQQPTGPRPVSWTWTQRSLVLQHELGKPMASQLEVPVGQDQFRFWRRASTTRPRRACLAGDVSSSRDRANGGRNSRVAELLALRRRASCSSKKSRAAIAGDRGRSGAGAKTWL